jgi:hypothetical protein
VDPKSLSAFATIAGIVGGLAGLASLAWTIVWSVTLRPRARWSVNRFQWISVMPFPELPPGPDGTVHPTPRPVPLNPPILRFYIRNIGTAAADDAHALVRGGMWERATEFPAQGRERIEPGGELVVDVRGPIKEDETAGRPYAAGDDAVFDLKGAWVTVRWRRQTFGLARCFFNLNRLQKKVPLV